MQHQYKLLWKCLVVIIVTHLKRSSVQPHVSGARVGQNFKGMRCPKAEKAELPGTPRGTALHVETKSHPASLSKPILNFVTVDNRGHEGCKNRQVPLKMVEKAYTFVYGVTATPSRPALGADRAKRGRGGGCSAPNRCSRSLEEQRQRQ